MSETIHCTTYTSPLGDLTLTATAAGLCGVYFPGHQHLPQSHGSWLQDDGARFAAARSWLDRYFARERPGPLPTLAIVGGTAFQKRVWAALHDIPPGQTCSYGALARRIQASAAVRAVGAAVGRNPLSILVPCHRVIGSNGALTGFAGGVERKRWLLAHELGERRQGELLAP